jgi:hypothetical protein
MTVVLGVAVGFLAAQLIWRMSAGLFTAVVLQRPNYRSHYLPTGVGIILALAVAVVEGGRALAAAAGLGDVSGPGVARGARCGALVDTTDIAATILTHLGRSLPPICQSRPLQPLFDDPSRPHRRAVFSYVEDRAMVRTDRWKLARYGDGDGELYDLDDDPEELRNLYGERGHAATRAELLDLLVDETLVTNGLRAELNRCPPDPDRARAFEEIRQSRGSAGGAGAG